MNSNYTFTIIALSGIFNLILGIVFFTALTPVIVVKTGFSLSLLLYLLFAISHFYFENKNNNEAAVMKTIGIILIGVWNLFCFFAFF